MRAQDYQQLLTGKLHGDREPASTTSRSRVGKTSQAVNAAIGRIADGPDGACAAGEEPVNERRLVAPPWAEHGIVCQLREEAEPAFAIAA